MRAKSLKCFALACLFSGAPGVGVGAQSSPPQAPSQAPAAPSAPAGTPLTLKQAEDIALKKNPQISVARLLALVSHQVVRETRSALFPTAFLSVTAVDSKDNSRITAGGLDNPIIYPRAAAGATVSQLITDFGRTTNLVSSSQYRAKAEEQNSQATRAQIVLAVDQMFYAGLEAQALLQVAQETVKTRQLLTDKVQALANAKLKSELDLSFAKVDLARAQLLLLGAQNNYQASLANLSAILGYPDRQEFQLMEEGGQLAPPSPDVAPLIAEGLQQRPEVAALQDDVQAAQKFSSAEHDLWRPTVSAIGVVGLTPVRDSRFASWYGAAGANVNIPVFNGFLYNAREKTADLQTEEARQRLLDMRNSIARDVRNSWQDSNQAYERLSVTKQLEEQANLALNLAQARYNLGLGSIVELSQAELQKTEADIDDANARYEYLQSQMVLAFETGRRP